MICIFKFFEDKLLKKKLQFSTPIFNRFKISSWNFFSFQKTFDHLLFFKFFSYQFYHKITSYSLILQGNSL
jgi:hypothetical protein